MSGSRVVPPTTVVWDDRFLDYDFGPGHPFQMAYRKLAVERLERSLSRGGGDPGSTRWLRTVAPAEERTLLRFHRPEYLQRVADASRSEHPGLLDRGDTPGFSGCFDASARIAAATTRAMSIADEGARTIQLSGGLHHAHPDRASGFCIFNDIAVGMAGLLGTGHRRLAYVDIDAHHGDGVMYGFYDDGRVLDIDLHQDGRTLFPGTGNVGETGVGDGAGLKVNLPLPPGTGDTGLISFGRRVVAPLVRRFRPELIVLQHGVDGASGDRLAQLEYTVTGYAAFLRMLLGLSEELCEGRLVLLGGGGYLEQNVVELLSQAAGRVAGAAMGPRDSANPPPSPESRWSRAYEDKLVQELERRVGTAFPTASPPGDPSP
jgi:acetoin utilization protein AcuC